MASPSFRNTLGSLERHHPFAGAEALSQGPVHRFLDRRLLDTAGGMAQRGHVLRRRRRAVVSGEHHHQVLLATQLLL